MPHRHPTFAAIAAIALGASIVPTNAADSSRAERGFEDFGARFIVGAASGEPANDMMGQGVLARYRLDPDWLLGFAVDSYAFDFEGPAALLGLQQSLAVDTIDTDATRTSFSLWAEREFGSADRWFQPFVLAGLGIGSLDVDDVTGPLQGGGTFDITTDPGTEFILSGGAGLRTHLSRHLTFEVAARIDYHLANWKFRDQISNLEGKIGAYHALGGHVGLTWRF